MISAIVPIFLLLIILLCKKIPVIGGSIHAALATAALAALLMGGVTSPVDWLKAWVYGIDTIAWVMFLTVFGSIYAQTQIKLGTMDTVFRTFKAKFGKQPRILAVCIILTLVVAGALLGGGTPSIAIVGVLMIPSLVQLGLDPTRICATLVMGGALGSLMPPVSQAIFLSSSLVGIDVDYANQYAYFTVASAVLLACLYVSFFFVKKDTEVVDYDKDGNPLPPEKVGDIMREKWYSLIPFFMLVVIIILRSAKIVDIVPLVLNMIKIGETSLLPYIGKITFIKGFGNVTVLIIILATIVSYLFPEVRKNPAECIVVGLKNALSMSIILIFSALMVGAFVKGGQIEAVKSFAAGLNLNVLKLGGALAMIILGMLTGTQSTPNNAIFSFFGPSLIQAGVVPGKAAAAGSHFAAAGQGMPPADLTTFFTAGLVSGVLKQEVDPVQSMIYAAPVWGWVTLTGLLLLYV